MLLEQSAATRFVDAKDHLKLTLRRSEAGLALFSTINTMTHKVIWIASAEVICSCLSRVTIYLRHQPERISNCERANNFCIRTLRIPTMWCRPAGG